MSANLIYWTFMIVAAAAAGITGVLVMWFTRKFAWAFLLSALVDAAILTAALLMWYRAAAGHTEFAAGLAAFYVMAFFSTEMIVGLALLAMRKNPDSRPDSEELP
jgi:hypothetical protein